MKRAVSRASSVAATGRGVSQACLVDGVLYVSGQVSTADRLDAQVNEAWAGVVGLVRAAGGRAPDIASLTVFVCGTSTDPSRTLASAAWRTLEPLVQASVGEPAPAVTIVQVVALARPSMMVEIQAAAHIGTGEGTSA